VLEEEGDEEEEEEEEGGLEEEEEGGKALEWNSKSCHGVTFAGLGRR
jgi:hypothetical protein